MSALDGWIDIFRTGTHRDSGGREREWDAASLDRIAAAFEAGDPAPVVVGHPEHDAPAWAWVGSLRRTGDRLQARLRDIAPEFREAVEAGRYTGRSVALEGDGEDSFRLRHLGFLGGAAPAVSGLAPTRFSGRAAVTYEFAAESEALGRSTLARVFRRLREWLIEKGGVEMADGLIADWEIEQVSGAREQGAGMEASFAAAGPPAGEAGEGKTDNPGGQAGAQAQSAAPAPRHTQQEENMSGENDQTAKEREELEKRRAELGAERETLERERAEFAAQREAEQAKADAARRLREADASLEEHVKEGRVLPAEQAGLAAFMASLPGGKGEVIVFAASGGGEEKKTPQAFFAEFLSHLPKRIHYGEFAGNDKALPEGADDKEIARRARAYHDAAHFRGEFISYADAVDAVCAGADPTQGD